MKKGKQKIAMKISESSYSSVMTSQQTSDIPLRYSCNLHSDVPLLVGLPKK